MFKPDRRERDLGRKGKKYETKTIGPIGVAFPTRKGESLNLEHD